MSTLKKEFEFYLSNQKYFLNNFSGKYIVLKKRKVIGVYPSRLEAIKKTAEAHRLGTFIVQHVVRGAESAHLGMQLEVIG